MYDSDVNTRAACDIADLPLSWRHIRIVAVASLGQLAGTAVATLAGVIIPMLNILEHPELSSFMQGLIGCADLVGIAVGSTLFGRLIEHYGYIFFFRFCPAMVLVAALLSILFPSVWMLIVCLFVIGLGIGGEYSLDGDYISDLMPRNWKSQMIGWAKASSALGNIIVAAICWIWIGSVRRADIWPQLMWILVGIAAVMITSRVSFCQSPVWLAERGQRMEAERCARRMLGVDVSLPPTDSAVSNGSDLPGGWSFFRRNAVRIVVSGIPWACEGLGVYGIGIFLPVLVLALGIGTAPADVSPVMHVADSVKVTFFISCIILPGFLLGLFLIRRKKYLPAIQWTGFYLSAVALVVLGLAYHFRWNSWIAIGAFMSFELFLNMGPHLVTYVLPPRIYSGADKALGSGVAATIGKIGAVMAVFFFPMILRAGGALAVLAVSAAVMLVGGIITRIFGPRVMAPPTR